MEDVENHPIPQDVTGFQFKIIGDITIKQFAYLAASAILAWVFYQFPIVSFIKLPVTIFLGGIGPSLAFVPLQGRPMDLMILEFIKAFFKPTRYVYQKSGGSVWLSTVTSQKVSLRKSDFPISQKTAAQKVSVQSPTLNEPINSLQITITPSPVPVPKIQATPPPRIISMFAPQINPQNVVKKPEPRPIEKIQDDKNEALKKKVAALEKEIEATRKEKAELEQKQSTLTIPQQQESLSLEKQLQAVLAQKEGLTKQLIALQQKTEMQKNKVFAPTMATVKTQTQNVRQIPKGMGKNIGLPITPEAPNIITGIIKDPRGNPLGNILVEVKDKEGNPVRAFKTNGLGWFASATALANGDYTILFEDPKGQNKFDAIGFSANGEVILPIEVTSVDEREELRKSLFREG